MIASVTPGTSRVLKMLQSFNGNGIMGGYPRAQYARLYLSLENEVPQSNLLSGNVLPEGNVSNPAKLEAVDELLPIIRMM